MKSIVSLTALALLAGSAFGAPPTAVPDTRILRTSAQSEALMNLLSNDSDPDNDVLHIVDVTQGQFGKVTTQGDVVFYDPKPDFTGQDTFSYVVSDGVETATAEVTVRNPFFQNRGTYNALFPGEGATNSNAGYIEIRLASDGGFSCMISFIGQTFRFKGQFGLDGNYTGDIAGNTLTMNFPVSAGVSAAPVAPPAPQITGTLTPLGVSFTAPFVPYNPEVPSSYTGNYSMLIPLSSQDAGLPKGTGFAKMRVLGNGRVIVSGKLGDSSPFSMSTHLSADGKLPFYAIQRPAPGNIFGTLSFGSNGGFTTLSGDLQWFRAKNKRARYFPKGFMTTATVMGSNFIEPTTTQAIVSVPSTAPNAVFTLSNGNLPKPKHIAATLNRRPAAGDYLVDFDSSKLKPTMKIDPRRGTFMGTFIRRGTGRRYAFSGVFVQALNRGVGLFGGEKNTGTVDLTPNSLP